MRLLKYLNYLWSKKVKKETAAKRAYRLLKNVPLNKWGMDQLHDDEGRSCFLGHYQKLTGIPLETAYHSDISLATFYFLLNVHNIPTSAHRVNDTPNVNGYTENHPKERIMHLLQDMIRHGY